MTVLLLDSGVWLAARDGDDRFHEPAVRLLAEASAPGRVAALDLTLYETANVATVRWRAPAEAETLTALVLLAAADRLVRVDARLTGAAVALASERRLTVYDAAYVACARHRGWQLVSTDMADLVDPGFAVTPEQALR